MPYELIIVIVLLLLSVCFEGAEAAFLSVNDVRIQMRVRKGDRRAALIEKMRMNTRRTLGTLLLGQKFCDVGTSAFATVAATERYGDLGIGIATGVMTLVTLIFMNLIPKSLAANDPERWSLVFARPLYAFTVVLGPVTNLVDRFVGLFVRSSGNEGQFSEEEIRTMAHMGVKTGAVEHGERELIERVFLLNDITAYEVLTPKELVVSLDARKPLADVLPVINSHGFSRYPVYDGSPDVIVGVVHIKDVLARMTDAETAERLTLRDVMATPVFVKETELVDDLFRDMKRRRAHMAIVMNGEKAVVGLVTLEDLLEELVGEISDESDLDETVIKRVDKHTILAHGDTDIPDINRFFNTKIEQGEERTVGRLVRKKAGKTPKQGQPVMIAEGLMAVVEQVSRGRILRVRLIKSVNEEPKP